MGEQDGPVQRDETPDHGGYIEDDAVMYVKEKREMNVAMKLLDDERERMYILDAVYEDMESLMSIFWMIIILYDMENMQRKNCALHNVFKIFIGCNTRKNCKSFINKCFINKMYVISH